MLKKVINVEKFWRVLNFLAARTLYSQRKLEIKEPHEGRDVTLILVGRPEHRSAHRPMPRRGRGNCTMDDSVKLFLLDPPFISSSKKGDDVVFTDGEHYPLQLSRKGLELNKGLACTVASTWELTQDLDKRLLRRRCPLVIQDFGELLMSVLAKFQIWS